MSYHKKTRRQRGGFVTEETFTQKITAMLAFAKDAKNGDILDNNNFLLKIFRSAAGNISLKMDLCREQLGKQENIVKYNEPERRKEFFKDGITSEISLQQAIREDLDEWLKKSTVVKKKVESYTNANVTLTERGPTFVDIIEPITLKILDVEMLRAAVTSMANAYYRFRYRGFAGEGSDMKLIRSKIYEIIEMYYNLESGYIKTTNEQNFSMNMTIVGSAGTGKSTLANSIADMFYHFGLLHKKIPIDGTKVEASIITKTDVIGEYIGHTAVKSYGTFNKNRERTMFLDEVYSFSTSTFGGEFIDALVDWTSNNTGWCSIIAAGYEDDVEYDFLRKNSGLQRRFPTKIKLKPYGLSSFVERLQKTIIETYSKFTEQSIKNLSKYISKILTMVLCSIYPDVKNFKTITDANNKINEWCVDEKIGLFKAIPGRLNFTNNLNTIYTEIMRSNNPQNREIMLTYIMNMYFNIRYNLLKTQQDSISQIIGKVVSDSTISPIVLQENKGKNSKINILGVLNILMNDYFLTNYNSLAGINISIKDKKIDINLKLPSTSNDNSKIRKVETLLGQNNTSNLNIVYTSAIIYFKRIRDKYLESMANPALLMNRSNIQKIPDSIDPVYIDFEYTLFKENNPDTPGFISVDYLDLNLLTLERPVAPNYNKPAAAAAAPARNWNLLNFVSSPEAIAAAAAAAAAALQAQKLEIQI